MTVDLVALEAEGWDALVRGEGGAYYTERMLDDGLMVVPGMVLTKTDAITGIEQAPPWAWYRITDARTIALTDDVALLVYTATAQRGGEAEYRAHMSSTYVRRGGQWKLAAHQQTPA